GGRDADAVDTRITVMPRRQDRGSDTARDARTKSKFDVRVNVHGRPSHQPGVSGLAFRNAIGQPVARREDLQRRDGDPHGLPEQIAKPAGLNSGQDRVGLSQTEPGPNRFIPARSPTGPSMPTA